MDDPNQPVNDQNQNAETKTSPTDPATPASAPMTDQPTDKPSKGYGKKPVWFWVAVYVGVGAVVYLAIYYFFFAHKAGGSLY